VGLLYHCQHVCLDGGRTTSATFGFDRQEHLFYTGGMDARLKEGTMSRLRSVLLAVDDRREVWMGVVAIVMTVLFILFPGIPESLFLAVDVVLIALIGAEANREAKRRRESRSSRYDVRVPRCEEKRVGALGRTRLALRKG